MSLSWIAYQTILRKEITRFMRIWVQTLVPPVITMTLYFIIFGQLIGARIGTMGGFSYMQFIVPGLIMMSALTNSFSNVASSFYSTKFARNVEELLVAPVSAHTIILGYISGGMARGILVGFLVTIVSLFFVPLHIHSWLVISLILLMTTAAFSLGGLINAIFARSFDDTSIIPTFILTPLTYLGGVFYSISLLPPFWQTISKLNPIVYMINGFRFGFLGHSDLSLSYTFAVLSLFILALYGFAYYLITSGKGLRH
ncbi:ABC transporter permease [Mergibacter septicus]|uniref:Transport permease protein n=1 Tax=Mergibacter septicus TaxID=221402 RepID=A0A8D4ITQ0_9PAST|nr:ABC transporter permease [Mergibacter septicus]AWX13316.1 ABC transporter permease [Mergibacter septicus]AWX15262.1 ABC transporter permease [Mergibacter septicus]QDJ14516.1 ABC transporter permease [Mergibacter septicus]UTU48047.1 ABC transporter permease [Mergibacter septicus]WMR96344.1 ABC transporter permease [Mergibacter septicus]